MEQIVPFKDGSSEQNDQVIPFTDRNAEKNSPKFIIMEQIVPFTDRNSEQNSPIQSIWEQYVPCTDRNSEQNSPDLSVRANVFHIQLGTRNETFLIYTKVNVLFLPCKKRCPF